MYMLPGQTGEAWEYSRSTAVSEIEERWLEKYFVSLSCVAKAGV
jgi:hypothetical protein